MTRAGDSDDLAPTEGLPARAGAAPAGDDGGGGSLANGTRMGRYRIDALLGRGGMGEVYRAEQLEPVRRTVALKLMNARRLDARHLAYFEVERQMLAHMKHPAIAQVYDAGATPEGFPFFAMEFIEGSPLTTYCEQHRLGLQARLELFARVCEGVQHAHQKGVIHRDLKPGNILVTEVDGRPVPKIIDFGIATAASRSLAAGEHAGEFERAGTPDYMSPEQAGLEPGLEVDTRSDVYSLGVLLYELLAGRRPGVGADTSRVVHTGTGTTVPPPSAQIETLAPGNAEARADQLGLSRPRLRRLLRDELDWVVLKAMRRDRTERYASAAALADELRRFLDDRPLLAVPASRGYTARKWLRRHRLGFAAASAVALAVLVGFGLSLYGLRQANAARAVAEEQRALAEQRSAELERVAAFQQSMLAGIDLPGMGATLAAGLREQIERDAPDLAPTLEPLLSASSPTDLARRLIDRDLLANALVAIERDFADRPDLAADLRESVARVQLELAVFDKAVEVAREVADYRERALGPGDPATLHARHIQASALSSTGDYQGALDLIVKLRADAAGLDELDPVRLEIEMAWHLALALVGEREQALELQRALATRLTEALGSGDPLAMKATNNLGISLARRGEMTEARAVFEDLYSRRVAALGAEHEDTLGTMSNLAVLRAMGRDHESALELHRSLVEVQTRRLGREHPTTLSERGNYANTLNAVGESAAAEAEWRAVLAGRQRILGGDARDTLRAKLNLAAVIARDGERFPEALALEEEVIEGRTRLLGPRHPDTVFILTNHGMTLYRAGRPAEAAAVLADAAPLALEVLGERNPQAISAVQIHGMALLAMGRAEAALVPLRQAMALRGGADGGDDLEVTPSAAATARALRRLGRAAEAQALEERYLAPLLAKPADARDDREAHVLELIAEQTALERR
ncbi:serine/threonine-protein kinase [Arenimonas composti]|uniref:Protein kinase domain-containing protein n=1 Tax=Arenimonas composti TR7-09 = DSM 18010 TaxID=1121013 RepID=A0A091BEB5_9GAMM|nr:serine/threonine-protein kinase [Arenimonas composti]KFN50071.1 hypothetical protein P873_00835 [Arenimonas composti TR7-09 = DSM 18010]